MTSLGCPASDEYEECVPASAPEVMARVPPPVVEDLWLSLFCSFSFARVKMSSITLQFSAWSLSSFLPGVPVLLLEGVRLRVERPKGPFSCDERRDPRSGL